MPSMTRLRQCGLIDISTLEDNAYPELIQETQSGYLPATSGDEQEQGASSQCLLAQAKCSSIPMRI